VAAGLEPRPATLWWIFTGIGVACFLGLLVYSRVVAPRRPAAEGG
jgi:hypothetical protein